MTCTASGGTVVSSSLTGPGGVDLELQPLGRNGQNITIYSVTSGILSGRSNGDTYLCTAAALSSPSLSDSTVLRGIIIVHVYIILFVCAIIIATYRYNI